MKVLVTGAAGFIGSHICDELSKDYKVVGIDNLSLGKRENVTIKDFYAIDILDHKAMETVFRTHHFDAVFHFAANSDISSGDPQANFRDTFSTTCAILEKCKVKGIKQFIFPSSGAVYGEQEGEIREDSSVRPISHYGAAKAASEAFISSYSYMYGIKSYILRFPNVIGERMTHGALYDWQKKVKINDLLTVLGDGNQIKPYMYVKDLIEAIFFIWANAKEQVNYYNISGIGETRISDMASWFTDKKIIYQGNIRGWDGDIPHYKLDISKLKLLGWYPARTSNEAVKLTISKI